MGKGQNQPPSNQSPKQSPKPSVIPSKGARQQGEQLISKKAMHQMINSYLQLNNKLMDKICDLQEELDLAHSQQQQNSFHEEYSIMNTDFNQIEEHIKQYRNELTAYQQQVQLQLSEKNETISKLNQRIDHLSCQLQDQAIYIEQLQIKTNALEQTNNNLLQEIEEMELNLRRMQSSKNSRIGRNGHSQDSYHFGREFNESVEAELQKLINKLMRELEYEQGNRKNLAGEIKRLQANTIELEKEIIQKNRRIYSLQLKAIKNSKSNPNLTLNNIAYSKKPAFNINNISFDSAFQNKDSEKTKRKESKTLTLTLAELIDQPPTLQYEEKVYLCIRLLEAFIDKMHKKDSAIEQPSSIEIHNFATRQPHLYSIKINKKNGHERQKQFSLENTAMKGSNLIEMLQIVLQTGKSQRRNSKGDMREKGLALLISNAKKNANCEADDLISLKETLEQLVEYSDNQKYQ